MIPNNLNTLTEFEVHDLFQSLDDTERQVLKLRFGVPGGAMQTLEEVGKHLGITRDAVRSIELKAMSKLGWLKS